MNIIDALQALKDGKKIRVREWNDKRRFYSLWEDRVVDEKGRAEEINIRTLYALVDDTWELYAEPLKLTPEEIKALKLARDCGFSEIRCGGELELTEVRAVNDDRCHSDWVLAYKIPALENLTQGRRSFQITSNPMSISELLNDEVDK